MRTYCLAFLAAFTAPACGGQLAADDDCQDGSKGCTCHPNGSCDEALECSGSVCVTADDSQSGGGTGGSGGSAGDAGIGGTGETAGTAGSGSSASTGGSAGNTNLDCSEAVKQVYLVDSNSQFIRFEPDTMTFTPLGRLSCPASGTPNSMAINREGTAWVNYSDGEIFHVNIETLECQISTYVANQRGFGTLGMGFASDGAGSNEETLYVTHDDRFGMIDTDRLTVSPLGSTSGQPELTGNGLGELWGFAPPTESGSGGLVRQLDKSDGATLQRFRLSLPPPNPLSGGMAWAFAFWGGQFYIFYQGPTATTSVYIFNPSSGEANLNRNLPNLRIVGAAVSTCAPTE